MGKKVRIKWIEKSGILIYVIPLILMEKNISVNLKVIFININGIIKKSFKFSLRLKYKLSTNFT
jgi:hypothetical protein